MTSYEAENNECMHRVWTKQEIHENNIRNSEISLKYVKIKIGKDEQEIQALTDGGAADSIIDSRHVPKGEKILNYRKMTLISASGHNLPVKGTVRLLTRIGKLQTMMEFIVVENFSYPVLIALDVLMKYKVTIDYYKQTCIFRQNDLTSGEIPLVTEEMKDTDHIYNIRQMCTIIHVIQYIEHALKNDEYIRNIEYTQTYNPKTKEIEYRYAKKMNMIPWHIYQVMLKM
jgi:hypothetical protein